MHGKWSTGKCNAPGTKVIMFDGSTKVVEDIHPGDLVMGPDGGSRTVLETHAGEDDMYEVQPVFGKPFTVNSEHLLIFNHCGKEEVQPIKEYVLRCTEETKFHHKLPVASLEFEKKDLPLHPYILGVMLGDGSLAESCGGVEFTSMDREVPEKIASLLPVELQVNEGLIPYNRASRWRIARKTRRTPENEVLVALRKLGMKGLKSEEKYVPLEYKTSSREDRLEILAGLIDTDGYCQNGNGWEFTSKSLTLVEDFCFIANSLGIRSGAISPHMVQGGTYWRVRIRASADVPVVIPRKKAAAAKREMYGFNVIHKGRGKFFGFSLDGDHRYLLDSFFVLHNSPLGWHLAACIGEGVPFFGMETRKSRVLYIEVDTPMALVKERTDLLQPAENVWFAFLSQFNVNLLTPEEAGLFKHLRESIAPALVIVNTLRKVHQGDDTKSGTPSLVYGAFQTLFPGSAILFVHHDKKESADPKAKYISSEAFSGSQHWADDAQVCLHLVRHGGVKGALRLEHTKSQVSERMEPLLLQLSPDGSHIGRYGEETKEKVREVLASLSETGDTYTAREKDLILSGKMGVSERTAREYRLSTEGQASRGN